MVPFSAPESCLNLLFLAPSWDRFWNSRILSSFVRKPPAFWNSSDIFGDTGKLFYFEQFTESAGAHCSRWPFLRFATAHLVAVIRCPLVRAFGVLMIHLTSLLSNWNLFRLTGRSMPSSFSVGSLRWVLNSLDFDSSFSGKFLPSISTASEGAEASKLWGGFSSRPLSF